MILLIASIGVERTAPGTPHIQYQKTSERMTSTGFCEAPGEKHRCYRLAFDKMNQQVKPGRQKCRPQRVDRQSRASRKTTTPIIGPRIGI
jgi:hypothetical protein